MISAKILIVCIAYCLTVGCANIKPLSEIEKIKLDLIGHTMGGREKSWQFQSIDQIKDLKIVNRTENTITISIILHDSRTPKYFHANALLTYKNGKLISVGELFIRQLN